MARLTSNDYLKILDYYNIDSRGMKKIRRQSVAKDILASKLCRCIKKIATTNESRAISICKNSIFTKKRLSVGRFKCKTVHKNAIGPYEGFRTSFFDSVTTKP